MLQLVPLAALLLLAAGIDLRERRIPNWLTASIAIGGLLRGFMAHSGITPGMSLLGFGAGFALPLVLFMLNAVGGGDVKLLAAVGAWIGPVNILIVFVLKDVVGLVIVLAQAVWQRRVTVLFRNSAVLALNLFHVRQVGVETVQQTGLSCHSIDKPLPLAVPILAAVLLVTCLRPGGL